MILGDNIFQESIRPFVENFKKQTAGAKLLIQEVPDPQRYGVAEIKGDKIIGIEEKPKHPKSSYCVTGIYLYDAAVFEVIPKLEPSKRGELEITDVNNYYLSQNELTYDILKGWWTDAGTFESYLYANELVSKEEA